MADLYNQGQIHHQKGTEVWVEHETEIWVKGVISGYFDDDTCEVKTEDGRKLSKHAWELPLANKDPDNGLGEEDMTHLHHLHEAAILHNIRLRYWAGRIYTYTGAMLIAVNPFEKLSIYGEEMINRYRGAGLKDNEPHAYAIAEKCYRNMRKDAKSQSMMISGESGAGKTETVKIVMSYLAAVSNSSDMSRISDAVLKSNPILEAFGNAKTLRNDNSSRFGKFIEIQFNRRGEVAGAYIKTYLLEKSRVIRQTEGERSFHVFYQLCAGYNQSHPDNPLPLLRPDEYNYLKDSRKYEIDNVRDDEELLLTKRAMDVVGITEQEQNEVFRIVATVLSFGQISFAKDPKSDDSTVCTDKEALRVSAELLGVPPDSLQNALCTRRLFAAGESYTVPQNVEQVLATRDALAKGLYGRLFLWLVDRINRSIRNDKDSINFIGILDIFGFESFANNSFEQFCINFANEKLQQQFIKNVLKNEQEEYMAEGIEWHFVDFKDNQECLDLIEKRPLGILSLLDEECVFPKGSDDSFAQKVVNTHGQHNYLEKAPTRVKSAFVLKHYARDVCYQSKGFLDKNKDSLHPDAISVLQESELSFVRGLFPESEFPKITNTKGGPKAGILAVTVGTQFKEQLASLMERVASTDQHYICCIKPNAANKPRIFESGMTSLQLGCAGVLEAIKVSRMMYPYRLRHAEFVAKFKFLVPKYDTTDWRAYCDYLLQNLSIDRSRYEFGLTKVFFRPGALEELEDIRLQSLAKIALVIQRYYKGYVARRWFRFVIQNVRVIQAVSRMRLARLKRRKLRLAKVCTGLQSVCRMRLARRDYKRRRMEYLKRAIIDIPPVPAEVSPHYEGAYAAAAMGAVAANGAVPTLDHPPMYGSFGNRSMSRQHSLTQQQQQAVLERRASAHSFHSPPLSPSGSFPRTPTNYQNGDADEFDETRAVELHCGDLAALLTNNFERWQQVYGFKQFYKLYEKRVQFMCSIPAFNDRNLVALVLNALKSGANADWSEAEWTSSLLSLLKLFSKPDENCMTIWKMQGVATVLHILKRYENEPSSQAYGLGVIANLSRHEEIRRTLRANHIVKTILTAMTSFPSDVMIQRNACLSLDELMSSSMKEGKDAMKAILRAMQLHSDDSVLQIAGMSAVAKFSSGGIALWSSNKKTVGKNGGVEAVLNAMRSHPEDERVLIAAFAAIYTLAESSKNRGAIRHYTGDRLIHDTMQHFPDNRELQDRGRQIMDRLNK